jgi:hypothetical protein
VVHAYNPNTQETEAGEFRVGAQPRLNSNTPSQKRQKKKSCMIQPFSSEVFISPKIKKHISTQRLLYEYL